MRADHRMKIAEGAVLRKAGMGSMRLSGRKRKQTHANLPCTGNSVSLVSTLGRGIRALTLFGKPLMADDTEITVFRSSRP